jgi:HprK-related kinase A
MNVGAMDVGRFAARLADEGVAIRWGTFVSHIVTPFPELAAALHLLYADFPIESAGKYDFHVLIRPCRPATSSVEEAAEFLLAQVPAFPPFPRQSALAALEWGLNWCVRQCADRFLIIHGAAVERADRALLLPGPAGAGKSTLCAALVNAGWRLLSDELMLFDAVAGRVQAIARPIVLKNHSIEIIRRRTPEVVFGPAVPGLQKGVVVHMKPPSASAVRAREPASPSWIIMPRFIAGQQLRLVPISKAKAFCQLADNLFSDRALDAPGFRRMVQLIDRSDGYELTYSALDDVMAALDDLVHRPNAMLPMNAPTLRGQSDRSPPE